MKKLLAVALVGGLLALTTGCPPAATSENKVPEVRDTVYDPQPTPAQEDPLTQQAVKKSQDYFFGEYGTKYKNKYGDLWCFGFYIVEEQILLEPSQARPELRFGPSANYIQAKGLKLAVNPGKVSGPDKMNGLLWQGTVAWKADARRIYDATGVVAGERGWTGWHGEGEIVLSSTMEYRNGAWKPLAQVFNVGRVMALEPFKPECSAIKAAEDNPPPSLRDSRQQELKRIEELEQQERKDQESRSQQHERDRQETYRKQMELKERKKQEDAEALRKALLPPPGSPPKQ